MSRLFSDTVHIGLYPDRVLLTRVSGGFAPRTLARYEQPGTPAPGAEPASAALGALGALEAALQDARWHGAKARIVLSNSLVRYAIVPASDHLLGAADESALALLKFQQVHGGAGEEWDIRLGNLLSGRDQIAAALERSFVHAIREILQGAQLRLCALEPSLMRAFNRARQHIAGREFWFAQAEPGLLLLARVQGGNWAWLSAVPLDAPLSRALPAQLREAELLAAGADLPRRVYLYAPGVDCADCALSPELELVDLAKVKAMRPRAADQAHSLALEI